MHQARSFKEIPVWGIRLYEYLFVTHFIKARVSRVRRSRKSGFMLKHPDRRNQVRHTGGTHKTICRKDRGWPPDLQWERGCTSPLNVVTMQLVHH